MGGNDKNDHTKNQEKDANKQPGYTEMGEKGGQASDQTNDLTGNGANRNENADQDTDADMNE